MSLREITQDLHKEAEGTNFAKLLLSGEISKKDYAQYLYQMLLVYGPIEFGNNVQQNFQHLVGLQRLPGIFQDYMELKEEENFWLPSTLGYHSYLVELLNDPERRHLIKAHLYVRHMGDLFGGQIIKSRVPGSGKFYEFENPKELKNQIRAELTDDLGPEARVAFEWAIKIMRELGGDA